MRAPNKYPAGGTTPEDRAGIDRRQILLGLGGTGALQVAATPAAAMGGSTDTEHPPVLVWDTAHDLLNDTALTYASGTQTSVVPGLVLNTRLDGITFQTLAADETAYHVETAGGVRLWVMPINGRYPAEAFGVSTKATASENQIALRAALDAGPVLIGPGEFTLAGFCMKSGDDLWGSGHRTFLNNSELIPTLLLGGIAGDSMTEGRSRRTQINDVIRGETRITPRHTPTRDFSAGDMIAILSDVGYSDGQGHFKPAFQIITEILSVDPQSGALHLADAIYTDPPKEGHLSIVHSDDLVSAFLDKKGVPNPGITKRVVLGNMRIGAGDKDSWTRIGGTYQSRIGPLWIAHSHGGVVMNGLAASSIHIVEAQIRHFLLDLAYFSHNSTVRIERFRDDPDLDHGGRPLMALSEGAHHNHIEIGTGFASRPGLRRALLILGDGCEKNTLRVTDVGAHSCRSIIKQDRHKDSPMAIPGTHIQAGHFHALHSKVLVNLHRAKAEGPEAHLMISPDVTISSRDNQRAQIYSNFSGFDIAGRFIGRGTITISEHVRHGRLASTHNLAPDQISIGAHSNVDITGLTIEGVPKFSLSGTEFNGAPIQTNTPAPRFHRTIPAGHVASGDWLDMTLAGRVTGLNAMKEIAVRFGQETAWAQISPKTEGAFRMNVLVQFIAHKHQRVWVEGHIGGADPQAHQLLTSYDEILDSIDISIEGKTQNSADALYLEFISLDHKRGTVSM